VRRFVVHEGGWSWLLAYPTPTRTSEVLPQLADLHYDRKGLGSRDFDPVARCGDSLDTKIVLAADLPPFFHAKVHGRQEMSKPSLK